MGIKTVMTCDVGLNSKDTPLLGLRRFLDEENIEAIEFEAELSGFVGLLRRARSLMLRLGKAEKAKRSTIHD